MNITQNLLEHAVVFNITTGNGETSLHIATELESLYTARWLLSHGADLNAKGRTYSTPLMQASQGARKSMVRLLPGAKERLGR